MDILLLGGTGTLSSTICKLSVEKGYNVSIFTRGKRTANIPRKVKAFVGDFKDSSSLDTCFNNSQFDVIVDFLSRKPSDIERLFPIFKSKCKKYIFISSACVYQRENTVNPITEDAPKPNFNWQYSVDKYGCEKALIELTSNSSDLFYTIVRPYITYDDERIPLGITPFPYSLHKTIVERINNNKPWFLWDEGECITTVTHVDDFAKAVVGLYLNEKAFNNDFHITGDYHCSQKDLLEIIYKCLGKKTNVVNFSLREITSSLPEYKEMLIADRALNAVFDNRKIKAAVPGLTFDISINEGIKRVIEYWRSQKRCSYDYRFEGRIDKLISTKTNIRYKEYDVGGSKFLHWIIYDLFRYAPYKVANLTYNKLINIFQK